MLTGGIFNGEGGSFPSDSGNNNLYLFFHKRRVVEPIKELSVAPTPYPNFPRIENFFATACGGLFSLRSQFMALLILQRRFHCAGLWKCKEVISKHSEGHIWCCGARAWGMNESPSEPNCFA